MKSLVPSDMDMGWCGGNCNVAPQDCETLPELGVCTVDIFNQSNTPEALRGVVAGFIRVHKHDQGDTMHFLDYEGKVLLTLSSFLPVHAAIIDSIMSLSDDLLKRNGTVTQDDVGLTWDCLEIQPS